MAKQTAQSSAPAFLSLRGLARRAEVGAVWLHRRYRRGELTAAAFVEGRPLFTEEQVEPVRLAHLRSAR